MPLRGAGAAATTPSHTMMSSPPPLEDSTPSAPPPPPSASRAGRTRRRGGASASAPPGRPPPEAPPPPPPDRRPRGDAGGRRTRSRWRELLPPPLLFVGLAIFARSFFLSRTPFRDRSACAPGSGGDLLTRALGLDEADVAFLRRGGFLSDGRGEGGGSAGGGGGCWSPRRADAVAFVVVDALRFDFARDRLPLSIGSRLFPDLLDATSVEGGGQGPRGGRRGSSRLYKFVADPPTVTMQRLKGLTTGGLPTFADISGSFGGAEVEEDSWVEQLKDAPWQRRRGRRENGGGKPEGRPRTAFVGDDTWHDLFPTMFDDSHPYPSFNTRDLDTVDNGCLEHLPRLLDNMVGLKDSASESTGDSDPNSAPFELVVSHFLGVDHVGHTYGPNNPHMVDKLHQMDLMLDRTLRKIDGASKDACIVAFVLGDHGMTEDGNHGGGSDEEVGAGLFAHFSPECGTDDDGGGGEAGAGTSTKVGDEVPGAAAAFDSIHQIDLVPTISFLLGLPVPYANIGGVVPDLLPPPRFDEGDDRRSRSATPHAATALALNAAQVWEYLSNYAKRSRDLPRDRLEELRGLLDGAAATLREAVARSREATESRGSDAEGGQGMDGGDHLDAIAYRRACALFKLFLSESTGLGRRVWTQFDERGMAIGIVVMFVAWIASAPLWKGCGREVAGEEEDTDVGDGSLKGHDEGTTKGNARAAEDGAARMEVAATLAFMTFQCAVLAFGNSYIENEREVVTFFSSALCLLVFRRWCCLPGGGAAWPPLVAALCARTHDVVVDGHGLDPSLRLHAAHHPLAFLSSLAALAAMRLVLFDPPPKRRGGGTVSIGFSAGIDVVAMAFLAASWTEKRSPDPSRNGFLTARLAMASVFVGLVESLVGLSGRCQPGGSPGHRPERARLALFRAMMFVTIVTGPSMASTAVLVVVQSAALLRMAGATGPREVPAPVMAALWRLAIRHVFFATNHHCSFNRLQFSAAFVATDTFQFHLAGASLFANTFGWEILGSTLVMTSSGEGRPAGKGYGVWDYFLFFQWTEMLASCISVSAMKRHLMVWAIFAPRWMFAALFTAVGMFLWIVDVVARKGLSWCDLPCDSPRNSRGKR
ncbi:hypothetical protein ACHAWF_017267 [Thalassiosira exigua]